MSETYSPVEDLEAIRADVLPKMKNLAEAQASDLPEDQFASDAEGVFEPLLGPLDDLKVIPESLVNEQKKMHKKLNELVSRLGIITDIAELFDPNTRHDAKFWSDPEKMSAGVVTNTHDEASENGGTVARVDFQYIPTGVPIVDLLRDDGSITEITETASLDVMRSEGKAGERWVEVAVSRHLRSELAKHGTQTDRRVSYFFDPRDPENTLPYVRIGRGKAPGLAIAGSEAWQTGLDEIYKTIELIEAAEWPERLR